MTKRIGITFFLFMLCMGALGVQLMRVPLIMPAAQQHGSSRVVIDESRGAIYDRSGERLVQSAGQVYIAAKPTPAADAFLRSVLSAKRYAEIEPRLAKANLVTAPLEGAAAQYAKQEDVLFFNAYPRYTTNQLAPHLIGYLDGQTGAGISGLEKSFNTLLTGAAGELAVRLAADANGHSLAGAKLEAQDENYRSREGIQLTLDARAQRIAQDALAQCGVTQGAVVVLDCATAEIIAMASVPAFDPNNIAASLQDPLEPFFNRALGAYPVGSTFKCFVAAAALDQNIPPATQFTCVGELEVAGRVYRCKEKPEGHGVVDMTQALAQSCNLYFIQLAQQMQRQPASDLLRLFGFGEGLELAPELSSARGNLPSQEELALPGEWANLSFGQGKLLATPLQLAAAVACIANGGEYHTPTLVKALTDQSGGAAAYHQDKEQREVISPEITQLLRQMMITTVEEGSGRRARPETGGAGGKTATAQSGRFAADGSELLQTGFIGFFPAQQPRYALAVFRQNGRSGAGDCAPVFKKIADGIIAAGIVP